MDLPTFLSTMAQIKPKQYHMKDLRGGPPLLPCVIFDSGHASIAITANSIAKKKFSYTHLTQAFTFERSEDDVDPAALVNNESIKIRNLKRSMDKEKYRLA